MLNNGNLDPNHAHLSIEPIVPDNHIIPLYKIPWSYVSGSRVIHSLSVYLVIHKNDKNIELQNQKTYGHDCKGACKDPGIRRKMNNVSCDRFVDMREKPNCFEN